MGARDLQPTQSSRSAGSTSSFVTSCPAGGLDPPGLPPVAKVFTRPTSSKRAKKPSALDKHLRHVVLLQRSNRHKAHQRAATAQHNSKQRQRFADCSHALRSAILHRGDSPSSSRDCSRSPEGAEHAHAEDHSRTAQPVTAPAASANPFPAKNAPAGQQQDDCAGCADIIHAWRPVAAAAQTRELQESLAMRQQQLQSSLPTVLDPDTLRPDNHSTAKQRRQHHSPKATTSAMQHKTSTSANRSQPGSGAAQDCVAAAGEDGELDVDAFLDSLLLPATASAAAGKAPTAAAATAATAASKLAASPSPGQQMPGTSSSTKARPVPAWAVSEQQQAAAEAAAAEQEERQLLQFADGLNWQELLQVMGDDELAAAFKELELADAEVAEGRPDADRRWQRCFVTAINAAAMRGIAAGSTAEAAAGGPGSQQGDQRSCVSSASAIRRAEAAEARRQQLLQRLQRLTGTANTPGPLSPLSAAAAAGGRVPSVCGSTGSRLGGSVCGGGGGGLQAATAAGVAASDSWESSTVVSSAEDEVGKLHSAIKHLEAREVLSENGELKGVHSTASVRSMLSKLEAV